MGEPHCIACTVSRDITRSATTAVHAGPEHYAKRERGKVKKKKEHISQKRQQKKTRHEKRKKEKKNKRKKNKNTKK